MLPQPLGKLFLYNSVVDLRKSYVGLCIIVKEELKRDLDEGDAFVFVNRRKNLAKVLWWDRTGWCLLIKRLTVGRFRCKKSKELSEIRIAGVRYFFDGM